ncbi:DNAse I-like superfamily protein [Tanacetum coccineum]
MLQAYVRSGDKGKFPHSPAACLKEKTRAQITLDVLKNLDADILCLQELDNYDNFYREKVGQYDYSSIYVKRGGTKKDGCGIFYKHSKLELVIEEKVDYNDLAGAAQPIRRPKAKTSNRAFFSKLFTENQLYTI